MGRWNSEVFTGEAWEEDTIGMNVLRHDQPWDGRRAVVLMSDWWVRAHWGRAFEILDVAPNIHGQSWALMRKRGIELSVADLERPEDDPREYAALRHNVRQVQASRPRRWTRCVASTSSPLVGGSPVRCAREPGSSAPCGRHAVAADGRNRHWMPLRI